MWVIILLRKVFTVFACFLFIVPYNVYAADNSAVSAIVMDLDSLEVLYKKNQYEERSIASTTKIMTALLALESGRLNEAVCITADSTDVEGSALGLKDGDILTLHDLVIGMMLTSGNDAANAVAYFLSGDVKSFCNLMNNRAEEIGVKNTYFVTPSGLDEGNHHSTAYDMAILTAYALKNDDFVNICSLKSAQIKINDEIHTIYNHNKLLNVDDNYIGVKTGFTEKAGRCLVSAKRYKGNTIICVTLCCPNDWEDHVSLINEAQKKYKKASISNTVKIDAVGGDKKSITAKYSTELYLLGDAYVEEYYYPFVYADVKKGDVVGTAYVYYKNILKERLPIEADEDLNYVKQQFTETSKVYG